MNTNMNRNGNMIESEIVWTNAYRSLFKYGPIISYCYVQQPTIACA